MSYSVSVEVEGSGSTIDMVAVRALISNAGWESMALGPTWAWSSRGFSDPSPRKPKTAPVAFYSVSTMRARYRAPVVVSCMK
jgi:hypothetical protein